MLEELGIMDKKPSVRSGGNSTESKKAQDGTNGKHFPKSGRKRETASSNGSKHNQNRKPFPQKGKALDKRPKPRGLYYGSGKENSQINDEDYDREYGSFDFVGGSKKQSLNLNCNHLLNFRYPPRGENMSKRTQQSNSCSTKSLMATQAHKYNKEQFLQANCQFVVREGEDYTQNLLNPDLLVEWNLIEFVVMGSIEDGDLSCPICLFPLTAGKITRCGHMYCWPCILQYLSLTERSWRKCPICYEAIHKADLKSVECVAKTPFPVGETITMTLMKKEKRSLMASPVEQFCARSAIPILSYGDTQLDTVYSKLLVASKEKVNELINREAVELERLKSQSQKDVLSSVDEALVLLQERINRMSILENEHVRLPQPPPMRDSCQREEKSTATSNRQNETSPISSTGFDEAVATNDTEGSHKLSRRSESESTLSEGDEVVNINAEDLEIAVQNSQHSSKYYYFYQASDGQQIYLHSVNMRTLETTYGSLELCPKRISGKIIEKEPGSMTPQLRKRLRYLEHVPITSQFEVVELDLKPPFVSEDALACFHDQIEERRKRRMRQARKEKMWEQLAEEVELRRYERRPTPNLCLDSRFHFPEYSNQDASRSPGDSERPVTPPESSSRTDSPNQQDQSPLSSKVAALSLEEDSTSGPSFAQMLRGRKGPTQQEAWPSIGGVTSNNSGNSSRSAWPRRQRQESINQVDSDNETVFSPPPKPVFVIGDAFEAAVGRDEKNGGGNGRKKRKKQQKILFSTGGLQKGGN